MRQALTATITSSAYSIASALVMACPRPASPRAARRRKHRTNEPNFLLGEPSALAFGHH
tara:strand:- start:10 stop:186 length:177 start_codon:yes stop_codon:yes gene_type:complete